MTACSKKDAGKTHKNRFKTGMVFRVQDQTILWIILPPTSPPPLFCLPGFMNSRVFMYLARWGGMWKGDITFIIYSGSSISPPGWKSIFVSILSLIGDNGM